MHSNNATNDISMNDKENFSHKYYAPVFLSENYEDVSSDKNMIKQNEQLVIIKTHFGFNIK